MKPYHNTTIPLEAQYLYRQGREMIDQQKDDCGNARFASAIVPVDTLGMTLKRVPPDDAVQEVPGYGLVFILPLHDNTVNCGTAVCGSIRVAFMRYADASSKRPSRARQLPSSR